MRTYKKWKEEYKPAPRMYETFGEDWEFIKAQNPLTVWTLCADGDGFYLLSGLHYVNRVGYYVAEIPFSGEGIYIHVPKSAI